MAGLSYTTLDLERREIRLLTLQPGSLDEQPKCDIEIASLDKKNSEFAALSYVWGDERVRKHITVGDNRTVSVTANLDLALRYLQSKGFVLRIWVDALCINQQDSDEKALQVGLMFDIYSKAYTTYMWMGAPVYYSDVAINSIRNINSIPRLSWTNAQIFAVRQLIERPYWTRVWVVQEAFYSRHAVVKCGHDEVNFDMFYDLVDFMKFHNNRPRADHPPESPDKNLLRFLKFPFQLLFKLCPRDREDGPIRIDLFRWLNYADAFASTLARDRIFAFLNLSFLVDKRFVKPDYSSTPDRRIFSEVTAYLMVSRLTSRDYLLPIQLRQVGKRLELPSWVPDWTINSHHASFSPPPSAPRNCAGQGEFWTEYQPLGCDLVNSPVHFHFSEDYEMLIIRGVVVDKVSFAVSIADGNELACQPDFRKKRQTLAQRQILDACKSWEDMALVSHCYGSALREAIWRTVLANQWPMGTSPAREDGDNLFEQWKDAVEHGVGSFQNAELSLFDASIVPTCELRALCLTEKGRVGLVPSIVREGDLVCLFRDGRIPFILREMDDCHRWIGEAYIHGIMFGEALKDADHKNVAIFHVR